MPPTSSPWTKAERAFLAKLKTPWDIQRFLNGAAYNTDDITRSPRHVIKSRKAHCMDGALFAAAALRSQGHPPLIVDLRAINDDDHVIAVFRRGKGWGAVAKSNFTTLKFREPVYRSLRELVMSYFDLYFNTAGHKTLREYSVPLDLARFDDREWMTTDEDIGYIGEHLDATRHYPLLSPGMGRGLATVDDGLLKAGLAGADPKGLYEP